ncbi:MAG: polysaccharide deacetylase family protein [Anaerolineales bacterium]|nr:polysaccharide deacetylase family protein [Chloroflexota bacterium]MBL6983593.1 polysaccharide deacetylase family protein [Anaerolineales bacterium]
MIFRLALIIGSIVVSLFAVIGGFVLLQPEWVFSHLRQSSPNVLYAIDTREKVVALTIDDGPDSEHTTGILDTLANHGAHATFFLITERVPGNEALVRRIVAEGHEIGNHMTEDEASINYPIDRFEEELLAADEVLTQFGDIHWMRPGSGWYSDVMLDVLDEYGYRCALGSVYPYDPQVGSAWFSIRYVLWKTKPGDIIVLHDYRSRGERTIKALESILPELNRRGYQVVTLSELESISSTNQ